MCELCKSRALHEGWVREGTVPTYDAGETHREPPRLAAQPPAPADARARPRRADGTDGQAAEPPPPAPEPDAPAPRPRAPRRRTREPGREPRHVRAVPMGAGQKIASAIEVFNNSEHRRTVAGVARSLGRARGLDTPE